MLAAKRPALLLPHLPDVISIGLGTRGLQHRLLAASACLALQRLAGPATRSQIPEGVMVAVYTKLEVGAPYDTTASHTEF